MFTEISVPLTRETHSSDETRGLGSSLAGLLRPDDVVLLIGELGTGKTCFAQGVAHGLEVRDQVTSPTFTLMREYRGRMPLYHLDAYRLEGAADLFAIGVDEYLDAGGVLLVEWGDRARGFFTVDHLEIDFFYGASDEERRIVFTPCGSSWASRPLLAALGGSDRGRG